MPPKVKQVVIKKSKMMKPKSNNLNIDMKTSNTSSLPAMKEVKSVDGKTVLPFYTTRYPFSNFYPVEFDVNGNFLIVQTHLIAHQV
jgi:hypothetical protein